MDLTYSSMFKNVLSIKPDVVHLGAMSDALHILCANDNASAGSTYVCVDTYAFSHIDGKGLPVYGKSPGDMSDFLFVDLDCDAS